jgi:hypothetical protein
MAKDGSKAAKKAAKRHRQQLQKRKLTYQEPATSASPLAEAQAHDLLVPGDDDAQAATEEAVEAAEIAASVDAFADYNEDDDEEDSHEAESADSVIAQTRRRHQARLTAAANRSAAQAKLAERASRPRPHVQATPTVAHRQFRPARRLNLPRGGSAAAAPAATAPAQTGASQHAPDYDSDGEEVPIASRPDFAAMAQTFSLSVAPVDEAIFDDAEEFAI